MFLSPEDAEALRRTVQSVMAPLPPEQALALCDSAIQRAWERMTMVVGTGGAAAIVGRAIEVASREDPDVGLARVSEGGVDLAPLEENLPSPPPEALCNRVQELYLAILQTLSELTGDVLVGPLLQDLKSWSKGVQP